MPVLIRPRAQIDLLDIWDYIATDNPDKADEVSDIFHEKFELIAGTPKIGRQRPELGNSIRSFPTGNYLIFYQIIEGDVVIVRVLHSARDITELDF